jgi:hypothetical protein
MSPEISASHDLSIVPLGAGDLIDRAVRFYRNNFKTFLFIAAPPVIVGTLVTLGWRYMARELFSVGRRVEPEDFAFYYLFLSLGTMVIWYTETVSTLVVMGGASRNFVRHLLFGEPISFLSTYRYTWARIGGLVVASAIIIAVLGFVAIVLFYIALLAGTLGIMLIVWAFSFLPPVAFILSLVFGLAAIAGGLWLFFLLASRFAYVPQVMLVEGRGAFAAIGRSASLAGGSVKRLMALFLFTLVATYSALALLYVPLLWYAWVNGIDLMGGANTLPASFEIMSQLVGQASFILLSPVWTVGLCLLYVDERVRHEGYDIELEATRKIGDIPEVPAEYINPLQPALVSGFAQPSSVGRRGGSTITTLGLEK